MRKVIFGGASSLDHYIAREDHRVDWILWSEETKAILAEWWATIDTILMGRKTYEVALTQRSGTGGGSPGMKTYVLSRRWKRDPDRDRGIEIISQDAVDFLGDLLDCQRLQNGCTYARYRLVT